LSGLYQSELSGRNCAEQAGWLGLALGAFSGKKDLRYAYCADPFLIT